MLVKAKRGWEMPETAATPESVYLNRREWLAAAAAGTILAPGGPVSALGAAPHAHPSASLYP